MWALRFIWARCANARHLVRHCGSIVERAGAERMKREKIHGANVVVYCAASCGLRSTRSGHKSVRNLVYKILTDLKVSQEKRDLCEKSRRQSAQPLLWKQTLVIQQARTQTDGKFYPKTTATESSQAPNWPRRPVPSEFENPFLLEYLRSKLSPSSSLLFGPLPAGSSNHTSNAFS